MCLFLHGRSFRICFSAAYQILFEIIHWTWYSRCFITHLTRLSRSLGMQPFASSSHHFWSEVKTHLHMPKNTAIIDTLGKELWKQSSATPCGLCTPKEFLKSSGTVCQSRSLQRQYICAVKLVCWHGLLVHPHCCWCFQFCILLCTVCTEVSLLPWGSPQGLQVLENRNKCHPEIHPAYSWLFRLPPEKHQQMFSYLRYLEGADPEAAVFHYIFASWIQSNEMVKLDSWLPCLTSWKEKSLKKAYAKGRRMHTYFFRFIYKCNLTELQHCTDQTLNRHKPHQSTRLWRKCNFSSPK